MRNLRIAHVADTHLGYRASAVAGRDEDFSNSWVAACQAIVDSKPDLIIHAGDVFHHTHPSWGAVARFIEGAYILRKAKVPVLMIIGNHDFSRLNMRHTVFSVLQNMFPDFVIHDGAYPMDLPFAKLDLNVILLPHPALLNPSLSKHLADITEKLDWNRHNILVAHGDIREVTKADNPEHGSIAIPRHVFSHDWTYIALGHLHMAQPFGQNGWYSGSIERCGWSDYPADPAWTFTTISASGDLSHVQRALPHRHFTLLETLHCEDSSNYNIQEECLRRLDSQKLGDSRAIVRIILDDISTARAREVERIIRSAVKAVYPNVSLQVDMKRNIDKKEEPIREHRVDKKRSIEDYFLEFLETRTYPEADMKEKVRAKSLAVLREAAAAQHAADLGDERNVPI